MSAWWNCREKNYDVPWNSQLSQESKPCWLMFACSPSVIKYQGCKKKKSSRSVLLNTGGDSNSSLSRKLKILILGIPRRPEMKNIVANCIVRRYASIETRYVWRRKHRRRLRRTFIFVSQEKKMSAQNTLYSTIWCPVRAKCRLTQKRLIYRFCGTLAPFV